MTFGKKLEAMRERLEMSCERFAKAVGISQSYYHYLVSGERDPTRTTLQKIHAGLREMGLEVEWEDLMEDE